MIITEWRDLIPIKSRPETIDPKERLAELVECLSGSHTEIMAHYADLSQVLSGPKEEIDAFMDLVSMQEEERADINEQIFSLLEVVKKSAKPSTPEELQAVVDSTAEFKRQFEEHNVKLQAQFAEIRTS